MPTINELRKRVWNIYTEPTPPQKKAYISRLEAGTVLEGPEEELPIVQFSPFEESHLERAYEIYSEFFLIAGQAKTPEEAMDLVLQRFEELRGMENPDLLYYALSVFITHHDSGRLVSIPNILVREPQLALSGKSFNLGFSENFEDDFGGASDEEGQLDWFREDPQQNEHHEHWHRVYPASGLPPASPGGNRRFRHRQGEMFLYMHQQMLARYQAERIAIKLPPLEAYSFDGPIPAGYNPGAFITRETGYIKRDRNTAVEVRLPVVSSGQVVRYFSLDDHKNIQQRLKQALAQGRFREMGGGSGDNTSQIRAMEILGNTLEPSGLPADRIPELSGYHSQGHNFIANSHVKGDQVPGAPVGVMAGTATAIRDSIFFRWHKQIDDFYFRLQEQYETRNYPDAPPVYFDHKTIDETGEPFCADIILCHNNDIPGMTPDFDGKAFGEGAFGGENWTKEFASGEFTTKDSNGQDITFRTTDTLKTFMNRGEIKFMLDGQETVHTYDYLNHEPFVYFLRIRNNGPALKVTCRIFLVPEGIDPETGQRYDENRRLWIEMDKMLVDLGQNAREVIFQFDRKSSVVRKPAQDPATINPHYSPSALNFGRDMSLQEKFEKELSLRAYYRRQIRKPQLDDLEQDLLTYRQALETNPGDPGLESDYTTKLVEYFLKIIAEVPFCDCGWPYNLLLPRGTKEGMKFKLMVMVTDAAYDLEEIGCCGSMSYCGAKELYPDKRPMGYPFDRKFPAEGIVDTLNALSNVAFRTIKIQCDNIDEFQG
jgi:tyrosinase